MDWAFTYPRTGVTASLREQNSDFFVDEQLGFSPCGEGEHVFIQLEKNGLTTQQAAARIADFVGVKRHAVNFSGMKDKHALTRQWFSVQVPIKRELEWANFDDAQSQLLTVKRHQKKLRRGTHTANHFKIVLRHLSQPGENLIPRLQQLAVSGVPNYFGEQRFGIDGQNIQGLKDWFIEGRRPKGKYLKGVYLSTARALLFNEILSQRVQQHTWQQALAGDLFMLAGSRSVFQPEQIDDTIHSRLREGDIQPVAPLWGDSDSKGDLPLQSVPGVTDTLLNQYDWLIDGLSTQRVEMAARPLGLRPENLQWQIPDSETVVLEFSLPKGAFATALLRELVDYTVHLAERPSSW